MRGNKSNKAKAEFQFDNSAPPVSLKSFLTSVKLFEDPLPDVDHINNFEDEEIHYLIPEDSVPPFEDDDIDHEITSNLISFAEYSLQDISPSVLSEEKNLPEEIIPEFEDIRHELPEFTKNYSQLTSIRLAIKALQQFSYHPKFHEVFSYDIQQIRSIQPNLIIDSNFYSILWLKELGHKHIQHFEIEFNDKLKFISTSKKSEFQAKPLLYALFLESMDPMKTFNHDTKLGEYNVDFGESVVKDHTLSDLFEFLKIEFLDFHRILDIELKNFHLIETFLKGKKHERLFEYFRKAKFRFRNSEINDKSAINLPINQMF